MVTRAMSDCAGAGNFGSDSREIRNCRCASGTGRYASRRTFLKSFGAVDAMGATGAA